MKICGGRSLTSTWEYLNKPQNKKKTDSKTRTRTRSWRLQRQGWLLTVSLPAFFLSHLPLCSTSLGLTQKQSPKWFTRLSLVCSSDPWHSLSRNYHELAVQSPQVPEVKFCMEKVTRLCYWVMFHSDHHTRYCKGAPNIVFSVGGFSV